MAVKLRLMRMGKKKQPTFRIVASDSRSPRDGRFIEIVGTYEPRHDPSKIAIDNAKAVAWLTNGATPSDTVRKLLEISGAWGEYRAQVPERGPRPARKRKATAKTAKKKAPPAKATKSAAEKQPAKKAAKKAAPEAADETTESVEAPPVEAIEEPTSEATTDAPVDSGDASSNEG